MDRRAAARIVTVLMIAALCCAAMAPAFSADAAAAGKDGFVDPAPAADASGDAVPIRKAWTHDAVSAAQAEALLNRQTLHPQPTGWDQLDAQIAAVLDASGASDACGKLWYVYQWMVLNVTYSWSGYSCDDSSIAAYNSFDGYDYLSSMSYAEGLQKSIPDDMANRAYHVLHRQMGVCYDYAIAFAVVARYVGIESYVRTGWFTFENPALGANHHGWSVLILDGEPYIFDPQRDARNWEQNNRHTGYYFCVSASNWQRYDPDHDSADTQANAQRDASLLPVTAPRLRLTDVPSGTYYSGPVFWAMGNGIAAGFSSSCFRPLDPCTRAQAVTFLWRAAGCPEPKEAGTPFLDLTPGAYYGAAVAWAAEEGITKGMSDTAFVPDGQCSRGQIVTLLWRFKGAAEPERAAAPFTDLKPGAYYEKAVAWAAENEVINGVTPTAFAPDSACTRGQIVTLLYRTEKGS